MDPQERKKLILAGSIDPIDASVKLRKNELAYTSMNTKRIANIDRIIEKTIGKKKRK